MQYLGQIQIQNSTDIRTAPSISGDGTPENPFGLVTSGVDNKETLLFTTSSTTEGTSAVTLSESRFNFDRLRIKCGMNGGVDGIEYHFFPNISGLNNVHINYSYGGGGNEYWMDTFGSWTDDTHFVVDRAKAIMGAYNSVTITGNQAHTANGINCVYEVWGVDRK